MDIQKIKDQLNQLEGYKGALLWVLQESEKEAVIAKATAEAKNEESRS